MKKFFKTRKQNQRKMSQIQRTGERGDFGAHWKNKQKEKQSRDIRQKDTVVDPS